MQTRNHNFTLSPLFFLAHLAARRSRLSDVSSQSLHSGGLHPFPHTVVSISSSEAAGAASTAEHIDALRTPVSRPRRDRVHEPEFRSDLPAPIMFDEGSHEYL